MRPALFVAPALAALGLFGGTAFAGSIDKVQSLPAGAEVDSITHIVCQQCSQYHKPAKTSYDIPSLKPGEQKVELKTIKGEQMIVRTEAWLGGSPVVFVSAATPELIAGYFPQKDAPAPDGIDEANKTAAVGGPPALAPQPPVAASTGGAPLGLDTAGFELRKN